MVTTLAVACVPRHMATLDPWGMATPTITGVGATSGYRAESASSGRYAVRVINTSIRSMFGAGEQH
jgi:hypothetical protein